MHHKGPKMTRCFVRRTLKAKDQYRTVRTVVSHRYYVRTVVSHRYYVRTYFMDARYFNHDFQYG